MSNRLIILFSQNLLIIIKSEELQINTLSKYEKCKLLNAILI